MAWLFFALTAALFIGQSHQQEYVDFVRQNYKERMDFQLQQQIADFIRQEVTYKAYASYFERADVALPGISRFFASLRKTAKKNSFSLTQLVNTRGGHVRHTVIRVNHGCDHIEDELSKGHITKPVGDSPARQEPYICDFVAKLDEDKEKITDKEVATDKPEKSKDADKELLKKDRKSGQEIDKDNVSTEEKPEKDRSSWLDGLYGLEDALAMERIVLENLIKLANMARRNFRDPQIKHNIRVNYMDAQVDAVYRVAELVKRLQIHQGSLESYELQEYLLDNELEEEE